MPTEKFNIDSFSSRLNMIMVQKGLKAAEMSRRTGIPENTLSSWINGTVLEPHLRSVAPLAKCLGVNLNWLLAREGAPIISSQHIEKEFSPPETGAGKEGAAASQMEGAIEYTVEIANERLAATPQPESDFSSLLQLNDRTLQQVARDLAEVLESSLGPKRKSILRLMAAIVHELQARAERLPD